MPALHEAQRNRIHRNQCYKCVQTAEGQNTGRDCHSQNAGNILARSGSAVLKQSIGDGIADGVDSTRAIIDLRQKASGKNRGEQRFEHGAEPVEVSACHGFAKRQAVHENNDRCGNDAHHQRAPAPDHQCDDDCKP